MVARLFLYPKQELFMMKTFKHALSLVLLLLVFCPTISKADSVNLYLSVGDEETLTLPYEFTSNNGTGNWSNSDPGALEVSGSSYSVKIKVLKWVYHRCLVEYDYYYTEDGFSHHITYSIFIDIRKPDLYLSANPSGGTVKKGQTVELTCNNYDAEIYYTLNGSTPYVGGQKYDKWIGITIDESCTLKAIASWGGAESDILEQRYYVEEEKSEETKLTLSASPSGGTVSKGTTVYLTASEYGADIYYTLDGTTPSNYSFYYSSGITINESCTLKAIAYKSGYKDSDVLTEYYTVSSDPEPEPEPTPAPSPTPTPTPTPTPAPSGSIEINVTNFPDANFRKYLLEQDYGKDGIISKEEIEKVTRIVVSQMDISSLKGIEFFTALNYLNCQDNQLASLNISNNLDLEYLSIGNNKLTSLNLSHNVLLEQLFCGTNQLSVLDLSNNPELWRLECIFNNLSELDFSHNPNLEVISCSSCKLTSLNVSKNPKLRLIWVLNNQLETLDVSNNPELDDLECQNNNLKTLDVSNNPKLETLYIDNNQIKTLDLYKNVSLKKLGCSDNQLTSLSVSKNTALERLGCENNQLSSLDVSNLTSLKNLSCYKNQLTALDVSNTNNLEEILCYENCLRGTAMDDFIKTLTRNNTNEKRIIKIISWNGNKNDNVCTTTQVADIIAKGWSVRDYNNKEYTGSDPSGINSVILDYNNKTPIYDLSGKRQVEPRKGINIINGKKIIVK